MPDKKDHPSAPADPTHGAHPPAAPAQVTPQKPRFDPSQLKGKGGPHNHQALGKGQSFFRPRGK